MIYIQGRYHGAKGSCRVRQRRRQDFHAWTQPGRPLAVGLSPARRPRACAPRRARHSARADGDGYRRVVRRPRWFRRCAAPGGGPASAAAARCRGLVRVNYLLDTNAVIALLKNDPATVRKRLKRALGRGGAVAVSSVVVYELWYGVARSRRQRENTERLRVFLSGAVNVVPFEEEDASIAGELRAAVEAAGSPIRPYDLLIAAQRPRT